jgi:hypothetical protein
VALLPWLVVGMVVLSTLAGLSSPPGDWHPTLPTIRGEHAQYAGGGLYRFDPLGIAREALIWDAVNLFVAAPAFVVALLAARRGSLRGKLARAGFLLYFGYAYLMYAMMMAFNALFPVYVAIFALCLTGLFVDLARLDPASVKAHVSTRFPRRFFAGFCFALSAALVVLWGARIVAILRAGQLPPEIAGSTTLVTQALDLGVVVPLAIGSGWLLLREHALGYVLTALTLTFACMMCISIPAWIVVPALLGGRVNVFEAVPFTLICVAGLTLAVLFGRNVKSAPQAEA